ncbi:DUF5103 domain-containing protein [Carboxylicivirga caseinilyticus]|uniref:type IX secretion system plug protein n=1 Tax=Carboxylicivirga caseinilyticus TaxID=3417572 RepID=UPI003D3450C0|nr:DUF5103 domain-containing protein [Marinilabiliaceae bacterium A049]
MSIFKYLLISTFATIPFLTTGNNPVYTASNIHTVQLHKTGWNQSLPIIHLNSQEELTLSFDDFAYDTKNYQYSIIHCEANWEESDLMQTEFIKGFMPNPVLNYQYSFNSTFDYIHYSVAFPNEDIKIKISGNYLIKIFELGSEDSPILTRPFYVSESQVGIVPQVKYTASASLRSSMQELHFTVQHPGFNINNPREDIKVVLQQNGRWDNRITNLKPLFIRQSELVYEHNREILFDGGNEFRWLDIRSTRFAPEYVESITFHDPHYHFTLFPDKSRGDKSYFYKEDFNGKYYIDVRENRDPEIEGDYVFVHFKLPVEKPILSGKVYVTGALSDWQMDANNEMQYNTQTNMYELTLLLKQGFYNYHYLFWDENQKYADVGTFEGNFGQTENDYIIYVYYRSISDNYDRLVGVNVTNSLKYTMTN